FMEPSRRGSRRRSRGRSRNCRVSMRTMQCGNESGCKEKGWGGNLRTGGGGWGGEGGGGGVRREPPGRGGGGCGGGGGAGGGGGELSRQLRAGSGGSGIDGAIEGAEPARRSDAVHAAVGSMAGAVVAVHGRGRDRGGDTDRESTAWGSGRVDRLLRQRAGVAD